MNYAQLYTTTNFTFLTGASHPQEFVEAALALGYRALAITDECSLAGIVKAYKVYRDYLRNRPQAVQHFQLLVGSRFCLSNGQQILVIAPNRAAYAELSGLITFTRRRAPKGAYEAHLADLPFRLKLCLVIWLADITLNIHARHVQDTAAALSKAFRQRLWVGVNQQLAGGEQAGLAAWQNLAAAWAIPVTACGMALMHCKKRKPLQDVLTAIRENTPVTELGTRLHTNAEAYLKPLEELSALYPQAQLEETAAIAARCQFSLQELGYEYPPELIPKGVSASAHLRHLVLLGKAKRYPKGVPEEVDQLLEKELALIAEMGYEYFFLTVYDLVCFARQQNILYQGRGSAANSVVCYCLQITNISPAHIKVLFERFISKERDEPPDIDVDFEHQRREEVIQYIYRKYGRERAALAATVITYRARSAIRDVGKALGLEASLIDHFAKSLAWWDRTQDLQKRINAAGFSAEAQRLWLFFKLVQQILGFPRHLSQHVGGFIIAKDRVSDLVPLENASMAERTVIQWDKEDLETMGLLKVDVLALGMLTALRKALCYVATYDPSVTRLSDIPNECPATYEMLCRGDSVGVFQVESRAQMSMLPRLRPRTFYDLVIQIAIVRPGPIQGDMVNPYLRRRNSEEPISYFNNDIKAVLDSTLGVPIFQEQVIRLAMVAAGFSGGKADELRRSMASWGKNSDLYRFEHDFIHGMLGNGYPEEFATRLFAQVKGFGGYGFPESHSASFALLCYYSSWLKCHHPAAFYCALLNSQPMGFYSASQLVQDARRHHITVLPVDINHSDYDHCLQAVANAQQPWGIRLGFCQVKSLAAAKAQVLVAARGATPFTHLTELAARTGLTADDLKLLAEADALQSLAGDRHQAHWQAAALQPFNPLLHKAETQTSHDLTTPAPTLEKNILDDYTTTGLTLRSHPLALLRNEPPFDRCKTSAELLLVNHGRFVRVAGLVTGRQRPGTAKGTIFVTLEDETGNINVVVWKATQDNFRQALLTAKLLLVKGVVEVSRSSIAPAYTVVHVVAGQLHDYSARLTEQFALQSRDFH